jgi:hypothetical protein
MTNPRVEATLPSVELQPSARAMMPLVKRRKIKSSPKKKT